MKFWIAGLSLWMASASALEAASGTAAAAFLDIPVGARPAAMGSAYTSLARDGYAPLWNPAGLGFLQAHELTAQHISYLESIHYEQVSYVHRLGTTHGLGVSAQYLGTGSITGRDQDGNLEADYSSHYAAYALGYGRRVSERIAVGGAAKAIDAKISEYGAQAYAVDAGVLAQVHERWMVAGAVRHAGTALKFLDDGDPLPLAFHLGAAWRPNFFWDLSSEIVYRRDGPLSGRFGTEFKPFSFFSLRFGFRTDNLNELGALAGFSTGFGLELWGHELAYAWVPYGDLGSGQYVTLALRFGADRQARQNLIRFKDIKRHAAQELEGNTEDFQLMQMLSEGEKEALSKSVNPDNWKGLKK